MVAATKPDHAETAYVAATRAFAAMAVRNLLALETGDPDVGAVVVACDLDGNVSITMTTAGGQHLGGYSL